MLDFQYLRENPENPYRLGRHQVPVAFDPDKDARHVSGLWFKAVRYTSWTEYLPSFDQGNLGSCTANAALGCLVTEPFGAAGVNLTETDAVKLYELETRIDDSQIPGEYPPNDTGSTGAWSMQALIKEGKIKDYIHTRSFGLALRMLNNGPISIGVTWYESMFTPDTYNVIDVDPTSQVAGGHQICIVGNDVKNQQIRVRNSWGTDWGDNGHAWLTWESFDYLLDQGGDVVQPVVK
jgi:hypothetical protein